MRVGWGGRQTGVESKNSDLGKNPDFGVPLLNPAYGKCVPRIHLRVHFKEATTVHQSLTIEGVLSI
jgi:hypothetical protein